MVWAEFEGCNFLSIRFLVENYILGVGPKNFRTTEPGQRYSHGQLFSLNSNWPRLLMRVFLTSVGNELVYQVRKQLVV